MCDADNSYKTMLFIFSSIECRTFYLITSPQSITSKAMTDTRANYNGIIGNDMTIALNAMQLHQPHWWLSLKID